LSEIAVTQRVKRLLLCISTVRTTLALWDKTCIRQTKDIERWDKVSERIGKDNQAWARPLKPSETSAILKKEPLACERKAT
jgi:hypothetical protein